MLARAREKFGSHDRAIRYVQCDLEDPAWPQKVGGPFDLVVSGIAIHNLKDLAAMAADVFSTTTTSTSLAACLCTSTQ